MPWSHTSPLDQQTPFIADDLRDRLSMTERCPLSGVSREPGDQWVDRALTHGPQGLDEGSRRPRPAPRHTPDDGVTALLDARQRHPSWGATKLVSILSTRHPRWPWPARSTVCALRSRHGWVPKQRRRRVIGPPGQPISSRGAPNAVWSADCTGHFKTGDGRYGSPLTISGRQPLAARAPSPLLHQRRGGHTGVHAGVPHMRPAAAPPHRQRRAVRHPHPGPALPVLRVVGAPRHPTGVHRTRQTAPERPPCAAASHPERRHHSTTRGRPPRPTAAVHPLPCRVHPDAAA